MVAAINLRGGPPSILPLFQKSYDSTSGLHSSEDIEQRNQGYFRAVRHPRPFLFWNR